MFLFLFKCIKQKKKHLTKVLYYDCLRINVFVDIIRIMGAFVDLLSLIEYNIKRKVYDRKEI